MVHDGIQALVSLGLTRLEAEIYTHLLGESPATGYRIASGIGKPAANTYKAIESLAAKGAIIVDEGQSRLCRAIPPEELLTRLERTFRAHRDLALESLTSLPGSSGDDRVYQIKSSEQVLERCRQMIAGAEQIVLADLFPGALADLAPELESAAGRGLRIAVKAYRSVTLDGVEVSVDPAGERVLARWPGRWLNLVVDGAQYVQAFLSADGTQVHQAIWSGSAYLSWVYHSALGSEFALSALAAMLSRKAGPEQLKQWLERHQEQMGPDAPGYRALLARFGNGSTGKSGADR
jgi:sugar-specific transcriptional regulator TrmB